MSRPSNYNVIFISFASPAPILNSVSFSIVFDTVRRTRKESICENCMAVSFNRNSQFLTQKIYDFAWIVILLGFRTKKPVEFR